MDGKDDNVPLVEVDNVDTSRKESHHNSSVQIENENEIAFVDKFVGENSITDSAL